MAKFVKQADADLRYSQNCTSGPTVAGEHPATWHRDAVPQQTRPLCASHGAYGTRNAVARKDARTARNAVSIVLERSVQCRGTGCAAEQKMPPRGQTTGRGHPRMPASRCAHGMRRRHPEARRGMRRRYGGRSKVEAVPITGGGLLRRSVRSRARSLHCCKYRGAVLERLLHPGCRKNMQRTA